MARRGWVLLSALSLCFFAAGCGGGGSHSNAQFNVREIPVDLDTNNAGNVHLSDNDEVTASENGAPNNGLYWKSGMSAPAIVSNSRFMSTAANGVILAGNLGTSGNPRALVPSSQHAGTFTTVTLPHYSGEEIPVTFGPPGQYGGYDTQVVVWHGPTLEALTASPTTATFTRETLPILPGYWQARLYCGSAAGFIGYCTTPSSAATKATTLWKPDGSMRDLSSAITVPNAIPERMNDSGICIGQGRIPGTYFDQGFAWSEATGQVLLPSLPGDTSVQVSDINSGGDIVGYSSLNNNRSNAHLVRWRSGAVEDLKNTLADGYAGVEALAINNKGHILAQVVRNGHYSFAILTPRTH